ncbi:FMN-dependent NADH-azoreductase [Candidatus Methanoplasma termitum]|uniref:AzoR protein n=1 Tax=Candidatus Methanoplasma termitum TaxID=1577791 RepID=A0A0A7LDX2_9ARCH|nr:NAD(P)H-dependent oxidoreductase [Candidatus Methanoplasma termitum]AIZ57274.1 FMN-dependent NADH-azoreductase [Candidatus Methanoplasma termitum]MCL2334053.1 NAD(P)H-dependent oxidoreductase [Candidatus Methanoplasma sp.]
MKVYIIVAYPNKKGLNYAAFEKARQGFQNAGHEIRTTNLYEERFNPTLTFDDEHRRRDMQFDEETKAYRDNIIWADHLVFVFPIWWSGMPAILKGFIDRVFAKGFAYDYEGVRPVGHLKNKTAWIINTYDTSAIYAKLFQQDYGRVLKKQVLSMCGVKTLKHTSMPHTRNSSSEKRSKWLDEVESTAQHQLRTK